MKNNCNDFYKYIFQKNYEIYFNKLNFNDDDNIRISIK